jgi:hypothetical protein
MLHAAFRSFKYCEDLVNGARLLSIKFVRKAVSKLSQCAEQVPLYCDYACVQNAGGCKNGSFTKSYAVM